MISDHGGISMKMTKKVLCVLLSVLLIATCAPMVFAADNEPFRINCAVNGSLATQRGITWFTNIDTATVVVYSDGTNEYTAEGTSSEWEGNFVHKVLLKDLEAGTTYTYKVGNGTVWSEEGSFTTDDGDDKAEMIVIADIQASSLENFEMGATVVNKALEMYPENDLIVNLGDFTNDSTNEEWDFYDEALAEINRNTTIAPVSGNHDGLGVWNWFESMFNLNTKESVQNLNGVNYSFDYGNIHCAVLNTNDLLSITDAQLLWLENDMNSTACDWKMVFMHKSPYTLGKDGKWPDALYLKDALVPVLDKCNVDIVMSGHDHMYLRTKTLKGDAVAEDGDGTVYVLAGTAGSKRYEIREFLQEHFMPVSYIDACVVQKDGYGNYFNGTDFESVDENNIGGIFNHISVDGGTLVLESYVVGDATGEATLVDTMTITKATGENVPTYEGGNTTNELLYYIGTPLSLAKLAFYTLTEWLFKFLGMLPDLLRVYGETGTF